MIRLNFPFVLDFFCLLCVGIIGFRINCLNVYKMDLSRKWVNFSFGIEEIERVKMDLSRK
jgi:hypothetical protein